MFFGWAFQRPFVTVLFHVFPRALSPVQYLWKYQSLFNFTENVDVDHEGSLCWWRRVDNLSKFIQKEYCLILTGITPLMICIHINFRYCISKLFFKWNVWGYKKKKVSMRFFFLLFFILENESYAICYLFIQSRLNVYTCTLWYSKTNINKKIMRPTRSAICAKWS